MAEASKSLHREPTHTRVAVAQSPRQTGPDQPRAPAALRASRLDSAAMRARWWAHGATTTEPGSEDEWEPPADARTIL